MKKTNFIYSLLLFGLLSCNTENTTVNNFESMKTPAMEKFSKAFRSLGDPENRPNDEEKRSVGLELSDRRKQILLPSAIELLQSEGFTDEQIREKTKGDNSSILVWAIQVYQEKSVEIQKKVNNQTNL